MVALGSVVVGCCRCSAVSDGATLIKGGGIQTSGNLTGCVCVRIFVCVCVCVLCVCVCVHY